MYRIKQYPENERDGNMKNNKIIPEKNNENQTAVVTVIGKDKVGIISAVSGLLADSGINIMDISQTIIKDVFTMIMLVGFPENFSDFVRIKDELEELGERLGVSITIQHSDIFDAMHRI